MKKQLFKKAALAASVVAGMAAAAPSMAAFDEAADGRGSLLIAPMYSVEALGESWDANIEVVNTSQNESVIAKVVFREPSASAELRDFLIFLTPGDKWVASISADGTGSATLTSADDSVLASGDITGANVCQGTFATSAAPFVTSIPGGTTGYMEVVGSMSFDAADEPALSAVLGRAVNVSQPPSPKQDLLDLHCALRTSGTAAQDFSVSGAGMMGAVSMDNLNSDVELAYRMDAFKGWFPISPLRINANTRLLAGSANGTAEVEAGFAASNVAVPLDATGETYGVFLFPTRHEGTLAIPNSFYTNVFETDVAGLNTQIRDQSEVIMFNPCELSTPGGTIVSPVGTVNDPECNAQPELMTEELNVINMSDKTDEVARKNADSLDKLLINSDAQIDAWVNAFFRDGWANVQFPTAAGAPYAGAPVVGGYIRVTRDADGNIGSASWLKAAHD